MANIKPNTFPSRSVIDGTEEIYTQTDGVNEKFTVAQVSAFLQGNAQETIVNLELNQNTDLTGLTSFTTIAYIYVPNPADLKTGATDIQVMFQGGIYFEFAGMNVEFQLLSNLTGMDALITVSAANDNYTETFSIPYDSKQSFQSPNIGSVIELRARVGTVYSQSDAIFMRGVRILMKPI